HPALAMELPEQPQLTTAANRQAPPRRPHGRLRSVGLAAGIAVVYVIWVRSFRSVDGLPDVGDPFDLAEARRPIPIADADNAYVVYAQARRAFARIPAPLTRLDDKSLTWSSASPGLRDYLDKSRAALELWREGITRPDAIDHQPGELAMDTALPLV